MALVLVNTLPWRREMIQKLSIVSRGPSFKLQMAGQDIPFTVVDQVKHYFGVVRKNPADMNEDIWFYRTEVLCNLGDFDGIFLLSREDGLGLLIKDDMYAEEVGRLIYHVSFDLFWKRYRSLISRITGKSLLHFEWDHRLGRGFIKNYYPDGTKLIVTFGRALDDAGRPYNGLFLGGGLPYTELSAGEVTRNETGMAYNDGKEWRHLWCTANEGLRSATLPGEVTEPTGWRFLGSRVVEEGQDRVVIWSGHEMVLDGVPLRMDRRIYYRAGDPYFVLAVSLLNAGSRDLSYFYIYGDEPWVGGYGSSAGDVGWVRDRLFFFEGIVDPEKYGYAGIYDYGNPVIGEGHGFTRIANFVEWAGPSRPDLVYFTNDDTRFPEDAARIPLSSVVNRLLVMQWGPRLLKVGQRATYVMAFGMALPAAGDSPPVKPAVRLDPVFFGG